MAQLMLVNPRKRRKTAKRKTVAANPRRRRRKTTKRRAVRRNPVGNPRRRRRSVARRRVRRNPRALSVRGLQSKIMPALVGGAGAVALDWGFNLAPLPAQFKTGMLGDVVKAVIAGLSPMITKNIVGKRNAEIAAMGALTVIAAKALTKFLPGAGGVSEYISGVGYMDAGAFMPSMGADLQYYSPTSLPYQPTQQNVGQYISEYDPSYASGY